MELCENLRVFPEDARGVSAYSFPCQDVSIAGKLGGITQGTRSGLLYEVERLLKIAEQNGTLPKYLLLENVKNLVSKRLGGVVPCSRQLGKARTQQRRRSSAINK